MVTETKLQRKNNRGRPFALTDDKRELIMEGIKNGLYHATAFTRAGIDDQTYINYRRRAEEGEIAFISLFEEIKKAEADHEYDMTSLSIKKIKESSNPIAPIVHLSRRFKERWSDKYLAVDDPNRAVIVRLELIGKRIAQSQDDIVDAEVKQLSEASPIVE